MYVFIYAGCMCLCVCLCLYIVNDKSYVREQFCSLLDFIQMKGIFLRFCFISIEGAVIVQSICRDNFCNSLKIRETVKLFSHVAFVIYGMLCVCCLCVSLVYMLSYALLNPPREYNGVSPVEVIACINQWLRRALL